MLNELLELASQNSSPQRHELMERIVKLFVDGAERFSVQEVDLFGDVILRLLKDVDLEARANLSAFVAPIQRTPYSLAINLAQDKYDVATPILTQSAAITTSDLISIALEKSIGHRQAIAVRPEIGANVTDILIKSNELPVLLRVCDNARAEISDWGFDQLAEKSTSENILLQSLRTRNDITLDATKRIMPLLSAVDRQKLISLIEGVNFDRNVKFIEVTEQANTKKGLPSSDLIQVRHLITQIKSSERKLDEVCRYFASENRPLDLSLVLSTFSGVPESKVSNALTKVNGQLIAILCRSLELSSKTYFMIVEMWSRRLNLPSSHKNWMIQKYEELETETALQSIRFMRSASGRYVA